MFMNSNNLVILLPKKSEKAPGKLEQAAEKIKKSFEDAKKNFEEWEQYNNRLQREQSRRLHGEALRKYLTYAGKDITTEVGGWRDAVQGGGYESFDSAGFFWIGGTNGRYFGNELADDIPETDTIKTYNKTTRFHSNAEFNRIGRLINTGNPYSTGNWNGETERISLRKKYTV